MIYVRLFDPSADAQRWLRRRQLRQILGILQRILEGRHGS